MAMDLKDVTFIYIIYGDSIIRIENLMASINFLLANFNTKIYVLEVGNYNNGFIKKLLNNKIIYEFRQDADCIFYRTKYLNDIYKKVTSKFAAIFDSDVVIPKEQIIEAIELLRNNEAQIVYPYTKFYDTSEIIRNLFMKTYDWNYIFNYEEYMHELYSPNPTGGAFICDLDSYKKIGLENEDFYGWGVEDGERYARWYSSGFKIIRLTGSLFHLTHPRDINSKIHNSSQTWIKKSVINRTRNNIGPK